MSGVVCGITISGSSGFPRLSGPFGIFDRADRTGRRSRRADLSFGDNETLTMEP